MKGSVKVKNITAVAPDSNKSACVPEVLHVKRAECWRGQGCRYLGSSACSLTSSIVPGGVAAVLVLPPAVCGGDSACQCEISLCILSPGPGERGLHIVGAITVLHGTFIRV